jgi:signal transduction histidine kinase
LTFGLYYYICLSIKKQLFRLLLIFAVLLLSSASYAQVALRRVLVNNKTREISKNNNLHLGASENELILEFSQVNADSVEYLYRFKGEENDSTWIVSAYPVAHYQNMKDGKYVFQIKTKAINSKITEIKIEKEIAFWNEWWFIPSIIIYGMILLGVVIYLFFLYDFRQKLRLQGVRNQIAADLHDEVGSNLNSIAIFVEVLRNKATPDILPILDKIIENSKESVVLMQDTVWTINPKNDSVEKLFERMRSFASQYLANAEIPLDFVVDADLKKVSFTMEQRKNIYLIFKESINNIVKHSLASKVSVNIKKTGDMLKISIEDNGKGFDIAQDFDGNGLQNFKNRAEEAEIECLISSELNKGTKIEIIAYC